MTRIRSFDWPLTQSMYSQEWDFPGIYPTAPIPSSQKGVFPTPPLGTVQKYGAETGMRMRSFDWPLTKKLYPMEWQYPYIMSTVNPTQQYYSPKSVWNKYSSGVIPIIAILIAGAAVYFAIRKDWIGEIFSFFKDDKEDKYEVSSVDVAREHYRQRRRGIAKKGPKYEIKLVSGRKVMVPGSERIWHRGKGRYSIYTGEHDKVVKKRGPMQGPPRWWLHTGDKPKHKSE